MAAQHHHQDAEYREAIWRGQALLQHAEREQYRTSSILDAAEIANNKSFNKLPSAIDGDEVKLHRTSTNEYQLLSDSELLQSYTKGNIGIRKQSPSTSRAGTPRDGSRSGRDQQSEMGDSKRGSARPSARRGGPLFASMTSSIGATEQPPQRASSRPTTRDGGPLGPLPLPPDIHLPAPPRSAPGSSRAHAHAHAFSLGRAPVLPPAQPRTSRPSSRERALAVGGTVDLSYDMIDLFRHESLAVKRARVDGTRASTADSAATHCAAGLDGTSAPASGGAAAQFASGVGAHEEAITDDQFLGSVGNGSCEMGLPGVNGASFGLFTSTASAIDRRPTHSSQSARSANSRNGRSRPVSRDSFTFSLGGARPRALNSARGYLTGGGSGFDGSGRMGGKEQRVCGVYSGWLPSTAHARAASARPALNAAALRSLVSPAGSGLLSGVDATPPVSLRLRAHDDGMLPAPSTTATDTWCNGQASPASGVNGAGGAATADGAPYGGVVIVGRLGHRRTTDGRLLTAGQTSDDLLHSYLRRERTDEIAELEHDEARARESSTEAVEAHAALLAAFRGYLGSVARARRALPDRHNAKFATASAHTAWLGPAARDAQIARLARFVADLRQAALKVCACVDIERDKSKATWRAVLALMMDASAGGRIPVGHANRIVSAASIKLGMLPSYRPW